MKTQEQNRQDVVNYLRTTAKHKFIRGKQEVLEFTETEDGIFYRVHSGKPERTPINIDWYIETYGSNAKNVIASGTFYKGHGYQSIRASYYRKLMNPEVAA